MKQKRIFQRMSEASPLVRLASKLGYKVYKEAIDFNYTRNVVYVVKNSQDQAFKSDVLSTALADAIKNDLRA